MDFFPKIVKQIKSAKFPAFVDGLGGELLYADLWGMACACVPFIQQEYSDEKLVPVYLTNTSANDYVLILAIWLCGKGYVPLAKEYPAERQKEIAQILTCEKILFWEDVVLDKKNTEVVIPNPNDVAYVLFTSGSTGKPKGVPISWSNLEAFALHYLNHPEIQLNQCTRFLQSYLLTFDVSVQMFLFAWLNGGTLYILPNSSFKYLTIADYINKHQIEVCSNVPTTAKFLQKYQDEICWNSLKYCFFSGDALYAQWAKAWLKMAPNAKVYNCYGPTETTIVCSEFLLTNLILDSLNPLIPVCLGEAFVGTKFKIFEGELGICGNQVFKGYLGAVTARFVNDAGEVYYLTGDRVEVVEGKQLVFKGRLDSQVKINGYRFDLEEIRMVYKDILKKEVLVYYIEHNLCIVIEGDKSAQEILWVKNIFTQKFPAYLPHPQIIFIAKLPLNPNLKIAHHQIISICKQIIP